MFEFLAKFNLFTSKKMEIESIPIKINFSQDYRNFSIEITDKTISFNSLFLGPESWQVKNKNNLFESIKKIHTQKLGRKSDIVSKINIGENAKPFENVKKAFYIWREDIKSAFRDIMDFNKQIRRDYKKDNLKSYPKSVSKRIRKLIKIHEQYFIHWRDLDNLGINIILNNTPLLDHFIRKYATVNTQSYEIYSPLQSTDTLLATILVLNDKMARSYYKVLKTKNEIKKNLRKTLLHDFKSDKLDLEYKNMFNSEDWDIHFEDSYRVFFQNQEDLTELYGDSVCNFQTFEKSKKFLKKLATVIWLYYEINIDIPSIRPGMGGDVDIAWKNDEFQLLLSIPEEENELAGLYGDNYSDDTIELDFDIREPNLEIIKWLKKRYSKNG